MTTIDGRKVFFGGDSFLPSSRWNGTGGFCAYNNSRFDEGFVPSAQLVLEWKPQVVAAGHGTCYRFAASKFRKIIKWAESAREAVTALCPSGDLQEDYYVVHDMMRRSTEPPGAAG
jgi:glyoxylase-like metal-dependent hydrolase (beta-lactamase superfamily II)